MLETHAVRVQFERRFPSSINGPQKIVPALQPSFRKIFVLFRLLSVV